MTANCPECKSIFRVDPAKVPATGVRARCSVCGGVLAIAGGTLPVSVTPHAAAPAVPTIAGGSLRATPIASASGAVAPPGHAASTPLPSPPETPAASPSFAPPMRPTPAFAATPPSAAAAVSRSPSPLAAAVIPADGSFGRPGDQRDALDAIAFGGLATALATAPGPRTMSTVGTGAAVTSFSGGPGSGRRLINPFLRADPSQRARRLARALVSDLVAYHPQKREEGLRDGTLRQMFREEIKKSYEEYVEQVGRDVAEGAPHFQDALNEILAGGRRLF